MNAAALFVAVFLACTVEAVEAATIVLAAGTARDWRSATTGMLTALATLVLIVAALGPALSVVPLQRLASGGRRPAARLRPAVASQGDPAGQRAQGAARRGRDLPQGSRRRVRGWPQRRFGSVPDWYGFTLSFKGVLLEGLEVAFIALTFGSNARDVPLAAVAAVCAVLFVAATRRRGARSPFPCS